MTAVAFIAGLVVGVVLYELVFVTAVAFIAGLVVGVVLYELWYRRRS